jgi:hypothetical protein
MAQLQGLKIKINNLRFYSLCLKTDEFSKISLNGTAAFIRNKKQR